MCFLLPCLEEEVIINELLLDVFRHPGEGVVDSLMVPRQSLKVVFALLLSLLI